MSLIDSDGEPRSNALGDGFIPSRLWCRSASAVVEANSQDGPVLLEISETGQVKDLGEIAAEFDDIVPVKDGYVAVGSRSAVPHLVYVRHHGERTRLELNREEPQRAAASAGDEAAPEIAPPGIENGQALAREDDSTQSADEAPLVKEIRGDGQRGRLVRVSDELVAFVGSQAREIWIVPLGGPARHARIDDSKVTPPEKSSFFDGFEHRVEGIEAGPRLIESHAGRLYVGRTYSVTYELMKDVPGLPAGAPVVAGFALIDVIDAESGQVLERIDIRQDIEGLPRGARWMGLRGDDLVFSGWRRLGDMPEGYISTVSLK